MKIISSAAEAVTPADQSLFEKLGGDAAVDAAVDLFYRKVLADPTLSPFFESTDMEGQRAKQRAFLTMAFGGPNNYTGKDLRTAHAPLVAKGLNETHFGAVAKHLQDTLYELKLPDELIGEVMNIAASTKNDVLAGDPGQQAAPQGAAPHNATSATVSQDELQQMLNNMPINVMVCDPQDLTIKYINETSIKTLKQLEHLLPCKAEEMLGQCIDIFHKDPAYQRGILSNPNNLPHQGQIQVGDEVLDLLVTAVRDHDNKYVGAMLTWSVITQKVKLDEETERLRQMVSNMPVNVMMHELENFTITYANATSISTLKTLEHLLPCKADELVGQCVDIFHKDPSFQRGILADPKNLPHTAHIEIGGEILDLLVSPVHDKNGHYVAAMLTWSVVTQKVKADAESFRLSQMVETMPVNVMMCETENFTITYANEASITTLKTLEHLLPCKADDLVGQCIDIFHKEPSFQRGILSNPKNLPHTGIIEIGGEKLDLLVSPVTDKEGNYIAAMLTWSVVTQKLKQEAEANRLQQMVEGMPINVMMCDPDDLKLNYLNKQARETLKSIEDLLPVKAEDLIGQCIDIFHKNPEHQRRILSDPKNLPHKAKIELGPHTLSLDVSAVMGTNGEYIGPMVAWSVVTEQINMANEVAQVVELVASASTEMQSSAQALAATAEQTNQQSTAVAAASEEVTANVQTVASSAEELTASVNEISRQVAESTNISQEAVNETNRTNEAVEGLAEAAQKIGDVVKLISDIAGQTNLLALNATIEAARAGEAGKGFAVVASEVKSLANQTAKATEDIAAQVSAIQAETTSAVTAIKGIAETINKVNEIAVTISSAVEEQGAATAEISRNVQEASNGTQEVTSNIAGVSTAAGETGQAASVVLEASKGLSTSAEELRENVEKFLKGLE